MQLRQYIHEMEVRLQQDSQAEISLLKIKTVQQFIMLKGCRGRMVDEPFIQPCHNYLKCLYMYHWLLPNDLSLD
jgi:hypothetical protein